MYFCPQTENKWAFCYFHTKEAVCVFFVYENYNASHCKRKELIFPIAGKSSLTKDSDSKSSPKHSLETTTVYLFIRMIWSGLTYTKTILW